LCQNNTLIPKGKIKICEFRKLTIGKIVAACAVFENGKSIEIPVNSSEVVDGFWRKCIVTDTSIQIIRG